MSDELRAAILHDLARLGDGARGCSVTSFCEQGGRWTRKEIRAELARLELDGTVEGRLVHGVMRWVLTDKGRTQKVLGQV